MGELVVAARRAVVEFNATFEQGQQAAPPDSKDAGPPDRQRQHQFDGLARELRDRRDRLARGIPFVVLTPDTEAEMAALVKGCIELT